MYCIRKKPQHSTGVACSYSRWRTWWSAATRGHRKGHWVQCSACQSFQATSCGHWFFLPLSLLSTEILWRFKDASAVHGKIALFFATQMYDLKYCCIFLFFLPSVSLGTAWHFRRIYRSLKWELNLISSWTGSIQKVLSFVCSPLQHFLHYGNHKSPAAIPGVVRSRVVCEHTEDCGITFKIIYHLIKVSRWKDTDLMLQCVMMLSVKQSTCAASDFTYARRTIWAGSCGKKVWRLQTVWWIIAMIKVCIIKH